jgi:hypothetical protein
MGPAGSAAEEYLMGRFLQSLIEAGKVPLYLDFRVGSLLDLSGSGNDCISAGPERWINTSRGLGISCVQDTDLRVAHDASLEPAQLSIAASVWYPTNLVVNPRLLTKGTSNIQYALFFPTGTRPLNFQAQNAVLAPTSKNNPYTSLGATWVPGDRPTMYWDHSESGLASGVVTRVASSSQPLYIGNYNSDPNYYNFGGTIYNMVLVNEVLSSADMVRLMLELEQAPSVVRRPTKGFSLPYPSKTPAQYVAASQFLDIAPRVSAGSMQELVGGMAMPLDAGHDMRRSGFIEGRSIAFEGGSGAVGGTPAGAPGVGATALTLEWIGAIKSNPAGSAQLFGTTIAGRILADPGGGPGLGEIEGSFRLDGAYRTTAPNFDSDGLEHHHVVTWGAGSGLHHYVDGVLQGSAAGGPYSQITTAWSTTLLAQVVCDSESSLARAYTAYWDASKVRSEWLMYAKKLLADASIRSDGADPCTLVSQSWPGRLTNAWSTEETSPGTWVVADDSDGRHAQLIVGNDNALHVPDDSAYGSWYFKLANIHTASTVIGFASQEKFFATGGYYFYYISSSNNLILRKDIGTNLDTYSVVLDGSLIEFWVSRRRDGQMTVWAKGGGAFANWTQVLQATDNAYTSCKYIMNRFRVSTKTYGAKHYAGEMTLNEALQLGLVS